MIDFKPNPLITLTNAEYDIGKHNAIYRSNYVAIFQAIKDGKIDAKATYRKLLVEDLWFMLYFGMQMFNVNHPFAVNVCGLVQAGPQTDTLDIWARGHLKTSILTVAETLQFELKNPEKCTGIYAYNRPAAKKPLRSIKNLLESEAGAFLRWCYDDVLWQKPESQSPKWSEDDGLVFKRQSASRGESSIEAWGLTEGMPTGRHFNRNMFDDLETEDIRESPDMLNKVTEKFEAAYVNLGTGADDDLTRIIGTYYSYFGPNVRIRDKKDEDGNPMFKLRVIPGSDNGKKDGKPIFISEKAWKKAKMSQFFYSQQLCDPTPTTEIKLNKEYLKPIDPCDVPQNILKFMVIDQAGTDETKKSTDLWSFGIVGIKPNLDEIGLSNVYLLDVIAGKMTNSEGIEAIVRMYLRNGMIMQLGVEKVGMSTTEIHIVNALKAYGRNISQMNKSLYLLKPGNRPKVNRVEAALKWPLDNGKLYYSTAIDAHYIDIIKEEMDKFPFFHVDILDTWAYAYDMFKEYNFPFEFEEDEENDDYSFYERGQDGASVVTGY
jgi:hypothetical protein